MPYTVRCQQHHSNPESSSVADHMTKVLLDYLINDISSRFATHSKLAASLQGLPLVNISLKSSIVDLNEAILFYSDESQHPR